VARGAAPRDGPLSSAAARLVDECPANAAVKGKNDVALCADAPQVVQLVENFGDVVT